MPTVTDNANAELVALSLLDSRVEMTVAPANQRLMTRMRRLALLCVYGLNPEQETELSEHRKKDV